MKLSPHFTLDEFTKSQTAARWGIDNTPNETVLSNLMKTASFMEEVRRICAAPIIISSGYRCTELNRKIGGSMTSQHMTGRAVDFTAKDLSLEETMQRIIASTLDYDQLILEYNSWIHISWSDKPRRQTLEIDREGTRVFA
jgi:zinc D-Ala-D-Ala carboxypeptidase